MNINVRALAEWAAAAITILGAMGLLVRWLDGRVRELIREVDVTCEKRIQESVRGHDHDQNAHANHVNTVEMKAWMIERRQALDNLKEHMNRQDVVLGRLATKLESIEDNLSSLRKAHDDAVSKGLCLYQQDTPARGRA